MKRILITGINGFLGRNIAGQMLSERNVVFGTSLHTSNIGELMSKVEFHECNLENILVIKPDIIKFAPDVIIHCAWWGGNSYADTNNPDQFHKNLSGAVHLMEILSETKRNVHFIGVGTSAEYGAQENPSETAPEFPISLYGTSKLMLKTYSERFCRLNDMSWTWVRPFYTYGPGDVATRLIPRTIAACVKREQLRLNSCDSVTDYLYVSDLVQAICLIVNKKAEGVYNLCSGNRYVIRDIVELIGDLTGNRNNIQFDPVLDRKNFPKVACGNNSKLKALGWNPKITLREGIKNLVWNE
jgi:nucleoside-diphosphate-sugar epimerase